MKKPSKNAVQAQVVDNEAPVVEPIPEPMDLVTALNNVTSVIRAFSGTAQQHELLATSLAIIRERCGPL